MAQAQISLNGTGQGGEDGPSHRDVSGGVQKVGEEEGEHVRVGPEGEG